VLVYKEDGIVTRFKTHVEHSTTHTILHLTSFLLNE